MATKKNESMAMTRSNEPRTKRTPTMVLRNSANVGVPPVLTFAALAEKQAVAAHGVERARAEKLIGVHADEQRDDHDRADDRVAVGAEDAVGGGPERKRVAGDLVQRKNVEHRGVDQQIDSHDGEDAAEDCARDIAARVAHFFAEVDDAVPAVDGVEDRLQRQHDGDGERPARLQRGHGCGA